MTYMKHDKAPESVLKLSQMLRYVFDDCSKDLVPLSSEVTYIENFIGFQQMKSPHEQHITFETDIQNPTMSNRTDAHDSFFGK
jgi:two-component system LytT family sensor kinase